MKGLQKRFAAGFIFFGFMFCLIFSVNQAKAANGLLPSASNNLQIGLRRSSDLVAVGDKYMRVFYDGKTVCIEYYDRSFQILSKKRIAMELNLWGGFYAGANAYYLVEGQTNTAESDTAEVIRVIKYDTNWNRVGAARITGNESLYSKVRYPFDAGCVEMTEHEGTLYIVTGHEGYVDDAVGQGHQGLLMIAVDEAAMTGEIVASNLWHSFAQYIKNRDSALYVLEQSEGSRCTQLSRYDTKTFQKQSLSVLPYGGERTSAWAVPCYASVDGMALSKDHILCLGTSIDQSKYDSVNSDMPHNIYLTVTPMSDFSEAATTVKWLTSYTDGGKSFLGTKITRVNDNRFMISWEEYEASGASAADDSLAKNVLHYVFVDGQGNTISKEYTQGAPISGCQPIVKDSKVIYYASNSNMINFYSIDANDGKFDKKMYRVAGENSTWDLKNGVLTITGTGALNVGMERDGRTPVSSTSHWFVSSQSSAWSNLEGKIKKVVIKSGITSIPERAFACLSDLEEVEIEPGLCSIEKEAFYGCNKLSKVTIPASVTKIGDDILWTGYYWVGSGAHVIRATICTEQDSCALQYAKKNGVYYEVSILNAAVSGLSKSYTYNGKAQTPKLTVKLGSQTLKEDTDFTVTYSNNKEIGTATVKITGENHYVGTISLEFQIAAPAKETKLVDSKTKFAYTVIGGGTQVALTASENKAASTLNIPATVTLNGVTYEVTSIEAGAFKNHKKLKKVTIGSKIQTIGASAFYGCKKLTTVSLGKNVKSIGNLAFANCTSLKKITIPAKVEKIGSKAFYNCSKLTSMTIKTTKLTSKTIGSKAFAKMGKNKSRALTVKVPKRKRSAYKKLLRKKGLRTVAKVK